MPISVHDDLPVRTPNRHRFLERSELTDCRERRLCLFARGFGLHGIDIGRALEPTEGLSRPAITETMILLPSVFLDSEQRLDAYAAVAHAVGHLRFSEPGIPTGGSAPMTITIRSLLEDVRTERLMIREYPGLRALWGRYYRSGEQLQQMGLTLEALLARLSLALHDSSYRDPHHWVEKGCRLVEAISPHLSDVSRFRDAASILANDLGQMRVRFDRQAYRAQPTFRDDNTYLWWFDSEASVAATVESRGAQAQNVAGTGNRGDSAVDEAAQPVGSNEARFTYPEWNYAANVLRDDWATVVEGPPPLASSTSAPLLPWYKRRMSFHIHPRKELSSRRLRRQIDGDEIDVDALVDHIATHAGATTADDKVYSRWGRRSRDASIVILLDLSASTARAVDKTDRSLLDLEREASEEAIAALSRAGIRTALHGFASNGREEVRYVRFKDFELQAEESHRQRLHTVRPSWSTRFGAALRHAGFYLERESTRSKTIILVTDGEPSDIDVFDPRYLAEDARQAIGALGSRKIKVQCVNVEPSAHTKMSEIFGWSSSVTLARGDRLSDMLAALLSRAVR